MTYRGAQDGQEARVRLPATCVGRRPSFGHWGSRLSSAVKAAPEPGSLRCARPPTIPTAPSAPSAAFAIRGSGEPPLGPTDAVSRDMPPTGFVPHPVIDPSRAQTMLTVLTQSSPHFER